MFRTHLYNEEEPDGSVYTGAQKSGPISAATLVKCVHCVGVCLGLEFNSTRRNQLFSMLITALSCVTAVD